MESTILQHLTFGWEKISLLIQAASSQWKLYLGPSLLAYLDLVLLLRFRRANRLYLRYSHLSKDGFSGMTVDEAFAIHNDLVQLEFPKVVSTATVFALFKTYGIPSVSSLLVTTGQIPADGRTGTKRMADTGALLLEAVLNPPASDRAIAAVARINYIHDHYRQRGRISDADMLYTLSLFALEPSRWVGRLEWRQMTDLELCALGVLWKSIGEAMEIPYDVLPSYRSGWRNGLEWLHELGEWSSVYEGAHMIPATSNKRLADSTIDRLLWKLPVSMKAVGKNLVAALLEDKLREAMLIEKPPATYYHLIHTFVSVRKFVLRYLSLPRIRRKNLPPIPTPSGRLHLRRYRVHPWYVKPTFKNRWSLSAWILWFQGEALPGDDGQRYCPEGFLSSEVGPSAFSGKGLKEMAEMRQRLSEAGRGGCPFLSQ
ncbi:hypothetical protein GJ744_004965 [Endocarpon pusillum]|uniref:ER-bound oxygenase mpaB/mpaB'/Rubber oxygenase catalytic domain-containing protein n=1 Tax=Endocarpon pusillum TaxID=364733 RepID=A0A8H7DYZ6_9EURO|nr:hypothetical protein GJ744_004965 [Endocarpon pusillum]